MNRKNLSTPASSSRTNTNLGFTSSAKDGLARNGLGAIGSKRLPRLKANPSVPQQPIIPTLNKGSTATILLNNMSNNISTQNRGSVLQPGMLSGGNANGSHSIGSSNKLPADLQDKINKWREKRDLRQQHLQQQGQKINYPVQINYSKNYQQKQEQFEQNQLDESELEVLNDDNDLAYDEQVEQEQVDEEATPVYKSQLLQPLPQPQQQLPQQLPQPQPQPQPLPQNPTAIPGKIFQNKQTPPKPIIPKDTSQLAPSSLFDATNQEILKGMIESEVKTLLDQLKKQRPELVNQAELMNMVNQKTRNFEDSLQQFNVKEQRLHDAVDQMQVTLRAIQHNIDSVTTESGGSGITEEVMRSWVMHFFNEQIGILKKDMQTDIQNVSERTNTALGSLKLLETKSENTLQNMFESSCFVYGKTTKQTLAYQSPDIESTVVLELEADKKILLCYPIISKQDKTEQEKSQRWMKMRTVDPNTAQLEEGWVPIVLGDIVMVSDFSL